MTELSPGEQQLAGRKDRAIDALSSQYSRNAMPLEEYERLVDYINKVESERELIIIEKIVAESAHYAGINNPTESGQQNLYGQYQQNSYQENRRHTSGINLFGNIFGGSWTDVTAFASREISGESLISKQRSILSFFGNTTITIGEGQLPPGRTIVNAVAIFGNTVVSVPPTVVVTVDANAILGNVSMQRGVATTRFPGCSELFITGNAIFGSIAIEVRRPRVSDAISKKIMDMLNK